mgnify:CR=1 FL=1|tara:strand:+ start:5526 stop:6380 length:855 start_codon:yes stop_codon:yes gene_type:complete
MNVKHSKYKNSGILFELLVRQITSDTLDGEDSQARKILHKYFVKTELGREYKLYESLSKNTNLTEARANTVLSTLLEGSEGLNRTALRRQKYNLIKEIKNYYDIHKFFRHKLPNYKSQAAFYTLIEIKANPNLNNIKHEISNKITILEYLSTPEEKQKLKPTVLDEFKNYDIDLKTLTYRVLLEKFNGKYDGLISEQKVILKELITSIDNTPRLKEFYNIKVGEIKSSLTELNKVVNDKTTQIKIDEVIKILPIIGKTSKVKDDDLINLLQYYDLIEELKTAHV